MTQDPSKNLSNNKRRRKMFRRSCKIALTLVAVLFIVRSAGAAELVIGSLAEPSIDPHYLYVATNIAYSNHIFG